MGSCAAPSAKGDDKFITTDYLQQCLLPGLFCDNQDKEIYSMVREVSSRLGCRQSIPSSSIA
ncbi:hypothetical protein U0B34_25340, partial [Escherichia coli]|nr:hypothetical protein [Escherichia coli]